MAIKIGVIGAEGRLGRAIASLAPIFPTHLDCDVLIDVSSAEALLQNLSANKPIVIGTTGHVDFTPMEKAAKELPIFYATNFSLGMAILKRIAREVAAHFPADIDLIETHHSQKKDAPSGTALALAKILPPLHIHSIRSGKVIGEHTLLFNNGEERITLSHEVFSREAFARGALAAAHFLVGKPPGLYTMEDLDEKRPH